MHRNLHRLAAAHGAEGAVRTLVHYLVRLLCRLQGRNDDAGRACAAVSPVNVDGRCHAADAHFHACYLAGLLCAEAEAQHQCARQPVQRKYHRSRLLGIELHFGAAGAQCPGLWQHPVAAGGKAEGSRSLVVRHVLRRMGGSELVARLQQVEVQHATGCQLVCLAVVHVRVQAFHGYVEGVAGGCGAASPVGTEGKRSTVEFGMGVERLFMAGGQCEQCGTQGGCHGFVYNSYRLHASVLLRLK